MSEKKEQWVHLGYDNARQAYILGKYDGQALICTYTAWLNHRTHTFKCYPRTLGSFETFQDVAFVHENDVKNKIT